MDELPEDYKALLRLLVKVTRETGKPEFQIIWDDPAYISLGEDRFEGERVEVPEASKLAFDYLEKMELLFCRRSTKVATSNRKALGGPTTVEYEASRAGRVTPAGLRLVDADFATTPQFNIQRPPIEITESLQRLRNEFPDQSKLVFLMMQFGSGPAHNEIQQAIRSAMEPHGFVVLRADDRQYHDDLFYNILTYIYGVQFGVAVFERIDHDSFNPNVSLEVGYMFGLNKSVCLLKDSSLRTLHSDLAGKLYQSFNVHNAQPTIATELYNWLEKKGFIYRPHV